MTRTEKILFDALRPFAQLDTAALLDATLATRFDIFHKDILRARAAMEAAQYHELAVANARLERMGSGNEE